MATTRSILPRPNSIRLGCTAALAGLLLTGCAALPDANPKVAMRTPDSIAAEKSLPGDPQAEWPAGDWWHRFGDRQLDSLITEALSASPDLQAAMARYRRALGLAEATGATLLPSLDVEANATLDQQSLNNGFPKEFLPRGWQDRGQIAARMGYEIDLWGRNRAALAAATSDAHAAALEAEQARLTLATAITSAYADLERLYETRDVRESSLAIRQATRRLVADRAAQGLENRGSVSQADAQVATAQSNLVAIDREIALRRHQIAVLIGAGPDRGLAIDRPDLHWSAPTGLPSGITTELVARRPDIIAARERVEAEAQRIQVARADFFPAIRLDALIGLQSLGLNNLIKSDSKFGSVGPAISLPIFRGGELQGRYRGAQADYDTAVAEYNGIVLDAYRQVADAVSARDHVARQLTFANAALAAAQNAYRIARLRYEGGLSPYLDVLTVEDRLLDARLAHAGLEANALAYEIDLVRALGGGFAATDRALNEDDFDG